MVPWVLVYGVNILGLFAGSIVAFYQMEGSLKSLGVVPLFWGTFILMGHILVMVSAGSMDHISIKRASPTLQTLCVSQIRHGLQHVAVPPPPSSV